MSGLVVDMLLLIVSWTHVLLAPYTKVEESFNLHSAHDVLMYGVSPESLHNVSLCNFEILCTTHVLPSYLEYPDVCDFKYDHNGFPGAVPRTFAASVLLSWITAPFIHAGIALGVITSKFDLQISCVSSSWFISNRASLSVVNTM